MTVEAEVEAGQFRGNHGSQELDRGALAIRQLLAELRKVIVGQDYLLERLAVGVLAHGHVLLEGVPGLGKTLAVKTLARAVSVEFHRIQFTPDLLPADLIGTPIYNPRTGEFHDPHRARSSPTSCSPTRSTARPPKSRAPCSKRWRNGR